MSTTSLIPPTLTEDQLILNEFLLKHRRYYEDLDHPTTVIEAYCTECKTFGEIVEDSMEVHKGVTTVLCLQCYKKAVRAEKVLRTKILFRKWVEGRRRYWTIKSLTPEDKNFIKEREGELGLVNPSDKILTLIRLDRRLYKFWHLGWVSCYRRSNHKEPYIEIEESGGVTYWRVVCSSCNKPYFMRNADIRFTNWGGFWVAVNPSMPIDAMITSHLYHYKPTYPKRLRKKVLVPVN